MTKKRVRLRHSPDKRTKVADPDPAVAKRVFEAMMAMKKIDVAAIEAACKG